MRHSQIDTTTARRVLGAVIVGAIGVGSATTFTLDLLGDAQFVGRLLGVYSVLFSGILVAGSGWLLWNDTVDRPLRVAGWCLAGTFVLLVIEWWLALELAAQLGGELRLVPARVSAHPAVIGGVAGFVIGLYDADRTRQYEEERRTRLRLESVLSAAPLAIVVLDAERRVRRWNDAAEQLFGWSESDVTGERPPIVLGEEVAQFDDIEDRLDAEGPITDAVEMRRAKSGESVEVRRSLSRIQDDEGSVGYLVIAEDVGERNRRTRELERSRDLLMRTQRLADIGGWELDLRTDELHLSAGTRSVYGLPDEAELGFEAAMEHIRPEDRESLREAIERCRRTGTPYDLEFRLVTATGRERWVRGMGEAVVEDGTPVVLRGTVQDITEQKQREQQLAVLHRLFRHTLRNSLNVVMGRAELLLESIESAASSESSRAVRPPDRAASAGTGDGSSTIQRGDEDERVPRNEGDEVVAMSAAEARDHLRAIHRQSEELVSVGNKTCAYDDIVARSDRGQTSVAVRPLFERLQSTYDEAYPDARIELSCADAVSVLGDPKLLNMAVEELLENALEHTTAVTPTVELAASVSGEDRVVLQVRDNGPGLTAYERAVVTADVETPLLHGDGVGLWLVNWIATLLGGTVRFADNEPRGTVVTLTLPRERTELRQRDRSPG